MPHRKAGSSFTALVLEVFRFHGCLLAAGDRLTKPLHLSSARWKVVGAIDQQGPLSVSKIARNMGLTRQTVQRLANEMKVGQFIEYAPNPDHRRAKLVRLTKKGRRVMKILNQRQIYWADKIAAGVNTEEIEAALGLIKKLRMRLDGND
ncbi:MAG TPA: MarR family transcriptional regulator [Candidatus Dormibacteraeota bacterium]|nr:MarR family transcriptional regulator [Candidatus Dormibacteraeota bacterium]